MRAPHATVLSCSGPARKYTAKFEPAAWSRAKMTSGFGAQKRIFVHKTPRPGRAPRTPTRVYPVSRCIQSGSAQSR
eukprot:scaffold137203_cov537-Phaeocystis_antarctica.AAC.1